MKRVGLCMWLMAFAGCAPAPQAGPPVELTGADVDLPPDEACPCEVGDDNIFLLSEDGEIWTFDPRTLSFDYVATACRGWDSPFSMAVSRKARAWIQYDAGKVLTLDLKDPNAACLDPGFDPPDTNYEQFGMAFVPDGAGQACDRMYVHSRLSGDDRGRGGGRLGVVDPNTLELTDIAGVQYNRGDLAAMADGRLFSFAGGDPWMLNEYDKRTGALVGDRHLKDFDDLTVARAMVAWHGYLYIFTTSEWSDCTYVHKYDIDGLDGHGEVLTTLTNDAPITIVGAGVATCAPAMLDPEPEPPPRPCDPTRSVCPD